MKKSTVNEVKRAARSASTPEQLFNALTEEHLLKPGMKVFIAGSMGMTNVEGTFKRMTDGGYAMVQTNAGEQAVLPQMVYPLRKQ